MSKPLKVGPSTNGTGEPSKETPVKTSTLNTGTTSSTSGSKQGIAKPGDISSPHELTAYVETLLAQLETRFDDMSSQILDRMGQMSTRVDALEHAIHDLINGDGPPLTPAAPTRQGSEGPQ